MVRRARVKELYGIYYIHQVSHGERPLFRNDDDRSMFLEILKRAQSKFEFKLYAYCILTSNEYHLVIEVNGGNLSNIMKSINIGYAMYAKSPHPLFKDRYKSQILSSLDEVQEKFQLIHRQGIENSIYNSYCHYNNTTPLQLDWIASIESSIAGNSKDLCEDRTVNSSDCINCIQTLTEARAHLNKLAIEGGLTTSQLLSDKFCRNQLIRDFRKNSTLTLKEIGILFGGLSESSICKILNN